MPQEGILGLACDGVVTFIYVGVGFGRGLEEWHAETSGKLLAFFFGDSACVLPVALVTHQDEDHFIVSILTNLLDPVRDVLERLSIADVVHEQNAVRAFEIAAKGKRAGVS